MLCAAACGGSSPAADTSAPPTPSLPAEAALGAGAVRADNPTSVSNAPAPTLSEADRLRWREAFPLTPLAPPAMAGADPLTRALRAAFVPYLRGDYTAAATAFDSIRLDHPDDPVSTLYLGICRLYQDEVPNALELLRGIPGTATASQMAEASWYGLVGIARLRDPSGARTEADALCRGGGPAATRACDALTRLGP
jgi:hypothetical protein